MIHSIHHLHTGAVIFTAEIEADENTSDAVKLGLAVKAAVREGANLTGADLSRADLTEANLTEANLSGADLSGADLSRADLSWADLTGAIMTGADLRGADLRGATGLNHWIKCIQVEGWPITYTSEVIQIGCQRHAIEEWRAFSDLEISEMDKSKALKFWKKWKATIFQIIEMSPARPTKDSSDDQG